LLQLHFRLLSFNKVKGSQCRHSSGFTSVTDPSNLKLRQHNGSWEASG